VFLDPNGSRAFALTENNLSGAAVGQALAFDVDGPIASYSIIGGTGEGMFGIDSEGNITALQPLDHEAQTNYTLEVEARDHNGATAVAEVNIEVLDRAQIVHNFITDHQTHTISSWESNDLIRIDRLSSDMTLQYGEAPLVYTDINLAKIAANLAQTGVVDVGVAYYLNGSGGVNAVAAVDEDAFGAASDLYIDIHNVQIGQLSASNFEFVA
jgi:hypothetical protein